MTKTRIKKGNTGDSIRCTQSKVHHHPSPHRTMWTRTGGKPTETGYSSLLDVPGKNKVNQCSLMIADKVNNNRQNNYTEYHHHHHQQRNILNSYRSGSGRRIARSWRNMNEIFIAFYVLLALLSTGKYFYVILHKPKLT